MSPRQYKRFRQAFEAAGGHIGCMFPATTEQAEHLLTLGVDAPAAGRLLARLQTRQGDTCAAVVPVYHTATTTMSATTEGHGGDAILAQHKSPLYS